jgi:hypothetical protein
MTLDHFEKLVQEYQPKFNLRYKGFTDIVGLFMGRHYIGYRLNKGELHVDNFYMVDDENKTRLLKRGRREILKLLVRRHFLTQEQASRIMYGYQN